MRSQLAWMFVLLLPLAARSEARVAALDGVGLTEHLGASLPLDATFTDQDGRRVVLGELVRDRPTVLVLSYFHCPMLCGLVLRGVVHAVETMGDRPGEGYHLLTVSFDPEDTPIGAKNKRASTLGALAERGIHVDWPFLVGDGRDIERLTDAVGFHFRRDDPTGQFAHPAAIFVITPRGSVSRYLYGVDYPPTQLRLALAEAAGGGFGNSFERIVLTCFHYDPATRRYEPYVFGFFRLGAILTLGVFGLVYFRLWKKGRKRDERSERAD